jgi:hypothetical protein
MKSITLTKSSANLHTK